MHSKPRWKQMVTEMEKKLTLISSVTTSPSNLHTQHHQRKTLLPMTHSSMTLILRICLDLNLITSRHISKRTNQYKSHSPRLLLLSQMMVRLGYLMNLFCSVQPTLIRHNQARNQQALLLMILLNLRRLNRRWQPRNRR